MPSLGLHRYFLALKKQNIILFNFFPDEGHSNCFDFTERGNDDEAINVPAPTKGDSIGTRRTSRRESHVRSKIRLTNFTPCFCVIVMEASSWTCMNIASSIDVSSLFLRVRLLSESSSISARLELTSSAL